MRNMNKKGVAQIVSMIALILLVSVASFILARAIFGSLNERGVELSVGINCLELQTAGIIDIESGCYNTESGDVELLVERKISGLEVPYLDFTLNSDDKSESYNCGLTCGNCELLNEGETKRYYFESESNQVIVHVGSCVLDNIDVAEEC